MAKLKDDKKYIYRVYDFSGVRYLTTTLILLTTILVFMGMSSISCSYKTTFYKNNDEVGRIESGSKGTYTYKDETTEMTAEFGKPLIELGKFVPTLKNND